ncbi:hypothetical protein [Planctomicrobium sp. SH664]|uniref:hypothetical protein n=1 Tax=Planctomicrobium sp. SH664 TaxID=3448125 RepID=UPI003F5B2DD6
MIEVTCPRCDKVYRLSDSLGGKKARCKACQATLCIPLQEAVDEAEEEFDWEEAAAEPETTSPPRRQKGRKSPASGGQDADSASLLKNVAIGAGATPLIAYSVYRKQLRRNPDSAQALDATTFAIVAVCLVLGGGAAGAFFTMRDRVQLQKSTGTSSLAMRILFGMGVWSILLVWVPVIIVVTIIIAQATTF